MKETIDAIRSEFQADRLAATSLKEVEELRLKYTGKKGLVPAQMQKLRDVPAQSKKEVGALVNSLKVAIDTELDQLQTQFLEKEEALKLVH